MQLQDIQHLAVLARLDISDEEAQDLLIDLQSILKYVDQVTSVSISISEIDVPDHRNIARDDVSTNTSGQYTDKILADAPDTQDGFIKVKKIL